jgi:hypothetical protein
LASAAGERACLKLRPKLNQSGEKVRVGWYWGNVWSDLARLGEKCLCLVCGDASAVRDRVAQARGVTRHFRANTLLQKACIGQDAVANCPLPRVHQTDGFDVFRERAPHTLVRYLWATKTNPNRKK